MYKVHITDNDTKERKIVEMDLPWPEDDYWWVDGNFACDCNRYDVFYPDCKESDAFACSHIRFTVHYLENEKGERIAIDE